MDWLLRVGDGINFMNSSKYKIWGISTQSTCGKYFIKTVKSGDRLWFVQNKSHGQIIAVASIGDQVLPTMTTHIMYVPEIDEVFAPLLSVLPMQLLSYYVGVAKGIDVDKPRNLAKSVTVE